MPNSADATIGYNHSATPQRRSNPLTRCAALVLLACLPAAARPEPIDARPKVTASEQEKPADAAERVGLWRCWERAFTATAKGDPGKGRAVFREQCAACHRLEGHGHAVGPDLMTTTDKPADWFLAALFDPNRAVEDRYVEYVAATADGWVVLGLLAAETGAAVTLRRPEGKEQTVLRRDLESLASTGRSPMPDVLEKVLSPQAVADLLAYIAGLRPGPADAPGAGTPPGDP